MCRSYPKVNDEYTSVFSCILMSPGTFEEFEVAFDLGLFMRLSVSYIRSQERLETGS